MKSMLSNGATKRYIQFLRFMQKCITSIAVLAQILLQMEMVMLDITYLSMPQSNLSKNIVYFWIFREECKVTELKAIMVTELQITEPK